MKPVVEQMQKTGLDLNKEQLMHVLHVDDDDNFLRITKRYLEKQGSFTIDSVFSVKAAQQKLTKKHYDAIISDYKMPEKTGLEFLKELRKKSNNIPFMLFTGMNREDVAVEALNLGADRYFNKNRNPETLFVELAHSLKNAIKAKKAEETVRNLAKFPSENPNPVMRVADDGVILYANNSAAKYQCENVQGSKKYVPDILRKTVVSSLKSGLAEEIEIDCGGEMFSLVVAPIPEEGYANVYGRNISESYAAWNSLEETMKQMVTINEKLSVVGRLSRHDARNKLAVILNYIYLAKKLSNNENITGYLQQVESAVDQIAKIFEFAKSLRNGWH